VLVCALVFACLNVVFFLLQVVQWINSFMNLLNFGVIIESECEVLFFTWEKEKTSSTLP